MTNELPPQTSIRFDFAPEKFASAIAYLVQRIPGLTKKQLCKLVYFADKDHLLQFGRPITGDTYHALPQGHVPSRGLDAINGKISIVGRRAVECIRRYGHLAGWEFVLDHDPDLKVFSRTELRVLDAVADRLGGLSAHRLERLSHNEPSWRKTPQNAAVDFDLFFDGHPEASLVREILAEEYAGAGERA